MANFSISPENKKIVAEYFDKRKKAIGLSKYSVGEAFAHGGMAIVYELKTRSGHVDYVLRVSQEQQSPYSNDIFNVREVDILKELKRRRQPNVVFYLDAFVVDIPGQTQYFCSVMKKLIPLNSGYCDKRDYREIAVRLGNDFLPLLQSLADEGIIHRDIKPGNIFFDEDFRNTEGFMLGDFGIAKVDDRSSATPAGTDITIAPEIKGFDDEIKGDRSKSDMYSLGIVMYYYLNDGVYPSNKERLKEHPDKSPFPEPRYGSKRLKQLVIKVTQYNPRDRFDSPQAMLRELQKCDEYEKFINKIVTSDQNTMKNGIDLDTTHKSTREIDPCLDSDRTIEESMEERNNTNTDKAVQCALLNQETLNKIISCGSLSIVMYVFGIVIQILFIVFMIYIRLVCQNEQIYDKFMPFEWLHQVILLGDRWAHLIFSGLLSLFVPVFLFIIHLYNKYSWKIAFSSFASCAVVQSVFVFIFVFIHPTFNTIIEQLFVFMISNTFTLALTVGYNMDIFDWDSGSYIGLPIFSCALMLIPSFSILLSGWLGLIVTVVLNLIIDKIMLGNFIDVVDEYIGVKNERNNIYDKFLRE